MKNLIIITLFVTLFSCNYKLQNKELEEYTSTFENYIKIMDYNCQNIYTKLEYEMNDYWGNPMATKKWYDKSQTLKKETKVVIDYLISIQLGKSDSKEETIDILFLKTEVLRDSLLNLLNYVRKPDKFIINLINEKLNPTSWPSGIHNFKDSLEQKAILCKIKADIKSLESSILRFLFQNVGIGGCGFVRIEPIVIPQSETVFLGEPYVTEIILGSVDSTQIIEYEIDDKRYIADEYKYSYKEKVSAKKGVVKKEGKLFVKMSRTGKDSIIPLTVEYEVIKEN